MIESAADLAHLGHRMLDSQEYAARQHREGAVPVLDAGLLDRPQRAGQPGVVEGDIETAEFFDRAIDHRLDVGLAGDVGFLKHGAAAVFLALAHRRRAAVLVEVGDHDRRAFTREAYRRRPAHPARRAGYHRDLAV